MNPSVPAPPQGGPAPAPGAATNTAARKKQINLPWPKAVEIAMNSLKIRFWRSLITAGGIFLSIAFLCFSLATLWLQHKPTDPNLLPDYQQAVYRQVWLVVMSVLVCITGITNSMLMSVAERFREIGTMKCLGALDSLIVRLFLIEAMFMGIVSSFGGWLLGVLTVVLVRWATLGWAVGVTAVTGLLILKLFVCCIVVGAALTVIASLLPSVRAAQMPPAAALRSQV